MRHFNRYFLTLITSLILLSDYCLAQNVNAIATIDKDSIYAGQPINYQLRIDIPKDYIIDWTSINDTIDNYAEVIDRGDIVEMPTNNGNNLSISRNLKLTTFDTGYIEIPRIEIAYLKSANDTNTYSCETNQVDIYVKGVSIDTTAIYRDIKAPIKQNITIEETTPYIGGVILLAGLVLLTIFLIRRFKKKESNETEEVKNKVPAIVTAREKMSQLKDANLWQSGQLKEYYTDLTDIVREYLEGQFLIEAVEMTSDEILSEVKKIALEDNIFKKLQDTLITADLVKFARANTTPSQNEEAFNNINTFIEDSYIHYQETEEKADTDDDSDSETKSDEKQEMEDTK